MIVQLAVATVMVLLTVIIHGGGLAILGRMLRGEVHTERAHHVPGFRCGRWLLHWRWC